MNAHIVKESRRVLQILQELGDTFGILQQKSFDDWHAMHEEQLQIYLGILQCWTVVL